MLECAAHCVEHVFEALVFLPLSLSSLITHGCYGDKRYQLQHLLYWVAFAGQEGRCVICSSVRCPWEGTCLSAWTLVSSLVCRYFRNDIWHEHIWPRQSSLNVTKRAVLKLFLVKPCSACVTVSIETTISGNIPHLTLDTVRFHGNTCLTSRTNMGYFCVKPE